MTRRRNPNNSRYSAPTESPGLLLLHASNRWKAAQREALKPLGLTRVRFTLLALLGWREREGAITQRELADIAALDVMTTSQALRALESDGLVERRGHPDDGRAHSLHTTESGRELILRAVPVVERCDEEFFSVVGDRREDLLAVLAPLARLTG